MEKKNLNSIFLFFLLIFLIFRETPYINLFFVDKIWVFYIALLFLFLLLNFSSRINFLLKVNYLALTLLLSIFPLFVVLLLTFARLYNFSNMVGIIIYFFLWLAFVLRIVDFLKSEKNDNSLVNHK